jgi:hypothetical protein
MALGERQKVAAVNDLERDFRVEGTKLTYLAILLRHEALLENGEFNEVPRHGKIEVGTKGPRGHTVVVPGEREFKGLVHPRDAVERQKFRENLLREVSESLFGS